jgi:hypothetical protein
MTKRDAWQATLPKCRSSLESDLLPNFCSAFSRGLRSRGLAPTGSGSAGFHELRIGCFHKGPQLSGEIAADDLLDRISFQSELRPDLSGQLKLPELAGSNARSSAVDVLLGGCPCDGTSGLLDASFRPMRLASCDARRVLSWAMVLLRYCSGTPRRKFGCRASEAPRLVASEPCQRLSRPTTMDPSGAVDSASGEPPQCRSLEGIAEAQELILSPCRLASGQDQTATWRAAKAVCIGLLLASKHALGELPALLIGELWERSASKGAFYTPTARC